MKPSSPPGSPGITLIVADDHPLFRAALHEVVARVLPDSLIIEAESIAMLDAAMKAHPDADLVLLDLHMPGARGFSALVDIRARHPSVPVALISATEDGSTVRSALDFGASGFIPKTASTETIGSMLKALLRGELAIPQDSVDLAGADDLQERSPERSISQLTPHQMRVLLLLGEAHSNKVIAQELDVSEATVKAHVTVILRKLGFERRTQAALLAQRLFGTQPARDASGADDALDAATTAVRIETDAKPASDS